MSKDLIFIMLFLSIMISAFAQNKYFSLIGKVYGEDCILPDKVNTIPLSHAYIQIKELPQKGWLTDIAGYFKIDSLEPGTYHLNVSFVGLEPYDTTLLVNAHLNPICIKLPCYEQEQKASPMLHLIVPENNEREILKRSFWDKYGLRISWSTQENLQKGAQQMSVSEYSYKLNCNQQVFEYLDRTFGYNWRFEAPPGIIGLDEKLDSIIQIQ